MENEKWIDEWEKSIDYLDFDEFDIHKFGNEIRIAGLILKDSDETYLVPFHDVNVLNTNWLRHINMTKEDWHKLIYQLDTSEVIVEAKDENGKWSRIILRKNERVINSVVQWNVFRRDNYTCQYCGRNDVPLTIDHIIRWENLGQTIEDNLITACKKCNNKRGNKEFSEWLDSDYYLKKCPDNKTHYRNQIMFEKASKLPLRGYKRGR